MCKNFKYEREKLSSLGLELIGLKRRSSLNLMLMHSKQETIEGEEKN